MTDLKNDTEGVSRLLLLQVGLLGLLYVKLHSVLLNQTFNLAWNDPDWGHALLLPLVSGFFVWDRREQLKSAVTKPSWWFLAPLLIGVAIYFASLFIRSLLLMGVAGGFSCLAVVLAVGGWPLLRLLAFPIGYLAFAMDLDVFLEPLSRGLQHIAVLGSAELIATTGGLMDLEAWRTGNVIQLFYQGEVVEPPLNVAEACSGLRMLVSLAAAGVAMAGLLYRPWWFRLSVAAATVPIAIAVNVGRITVLAFLAPHFPDLSHGELHTHTGGIVMLVPAIVLFLGFIRILDWILEPVLQGGDSEEAVAAEDTTETSADDTESDADQAEAQPVKAESVPETVLSEPVEDKIEKLVVAPGWLWPRIPNVLFGVIVIVMGISAFAEIAISNRIQAVMTRTAGDPRRPLTEMPAELDRWTRVEMRSYDEIIEREIGTPHYIDWIYQDTANPNRGLRLHLAFYAGNEYMLDTWHVPEVCYVGAGSAAIEAGYSDLIAGDEKIIMRHFSFASGVGERPASVFYTFLANGSFVANRHAVKYKALDLGFPSPYVCKIEVLSGGLVKDGLGKWQLIPDLVDDAAKAEAEAFLTHAMPPIRTMMPVAE